VARHFETKLGTPKLAVFAPEAAAFDVIVVHSFTGPASSLQIACIARSVGSPISP